MTTTYPALGGDGNSAQQPSNCDGVDYHVRASGQKRRSGMWLLAAAVGLVLTASGEARSNEASQVGRQYHTIVERNPFGLRQLSLIAAEPPNASPPRDPIVLTGITSIGNPRAYFMTQAAAVKSVEYYSLGIGEKQDVLEVLGIDVAAKAVRVRNAGTEYTILLGSRVGPGSVSSNR